MTFKEVKKWLYENKDKIKMVFGITITVGAVLFIFRHRLISTIIKAIAACATATATAAPAVAEAVANASIADETASNNQSDIESVSEEIEDECCTENPEKIINNGEPFEVKGHIRNLGSNKHASAQKRQEAEEIGINLGEHETIVDPYSKNLQYVFIQEPLLV